MPPIWFCLDCEGVAYGWAQGPCIHCGSSRLVSTRPIPPSTEHTSDYRLLLFTSKARARLEAEAILAGLTPSDLLTEQEEGEIVLIREEPVGDGLLVLVKTDPTKAQSHQAD